MLRRFFSRRTTVVARNETLCNVSTCVEGAECSLDGAEAGSLKCVRVDGDGPEATRLKRLGICEGQVVEVLRVGEPMIVRAAGTQVGLSKHLAKQVSVRPLV